MLLLFSVRQESSAVDQGLLRTKAALVSKELACDLKNEEQKYYLHLHAMRTHSKLFPNPLELTLSLTGGQWHERSKAKCLGFLTKCQANGIGTLCILLD